MLPLSELGGIISTSESINTSDVYKGSFRSLKARHLVCVGLRSTLGSVSAKVQAHYQEIALCKVS